MKGIIKKNKKEELWLIPPLMSIIIWSIIILVFSENLINSDMSAELILARELASEKRLLSNGWFYSTELRLLNTQLIAVPLFMIFDSFKVVRVLQGFILFVGMLWAYCFCMKTVISSRKIIYLSSGILFMPFSLQYLEFVLIGNFYIPHMILGFVMLGILFRLKDKNNVILVMIYMFLSMICGLSGVRYVLMIQLPAATVILLNIYHSAKHDEGDSFIKQISFNVRMIIIPILGFVLCVIGYVINEKVLHKYFSFYHFGDVMRFANLNKKGLIERVSNICGDMFEIFGYSDGAKVSSLVGVGNICSFFSVVVIIYILFVIIKKRSILDDNQRFIVELFCISFLIHTFVFVFTDERYVPRYYLVALIWLIPVGSIFASSEKLIDKITKIISLVILICSLSVTSLEAYYKIVRDNIYEDTLHSYSYYVEKGQTSYSKSRRTVCEFLEKEGYEFGYATFWNAGVMTELSEGKINIVNILDINSMRPYEWLMPRRYIADSIYSTYADGRVFLLLTVEEYATYVNSYLLQNYNGECVYNENGYVVYEYDKEQFDLEELRNGIAENTNI